MCAVFLIVSWEGAGWDMRGRREERRERERGGGGAEEGREAESVSDFCIHTLTNHPHRLGNR